MNKRNKIFAIAGATAVLSLGGGGIAYATGAAGGDDDQQTVVTGADANRAGEVAAKSVGGGTVGKVLKGTDGAVAYDVEIKKPDGTTVDVEITKDFTIAPQEKSDNGKENAEGADGADGGK